MNKNNKLVLFSVLLFFAFTACRKKVGDNVNLNPSNQTANDYMPTTAGSWWLYGAVDGTVIKRHATGKDSVKNGLLFSYYESVDTNSGYITPEYFGKNGDMYDMLIDLDGGQTNYMTIIVQRDSLYTGQSWDNTGSISYSGINFDLLAESHVVSLNGTYASNGKTYNNVVFITNNLKAKPSIAPLYSNCGTIDMWFVKGVGIVKEKMNVSIAGQFSKYYEDSLLDYSVAP
ncbi:hypothetical protein ACTHGU_18170 [Chitinophagaceae bacterium MMS25-I14]